MHMCTHIQQTCAMVITMAIESLLYISLTQQPAELALHVSSCQSQLFYSP